MIEFAETPIKAEFVEELRNQLPSWVVIRHEDKLTPGTPDISLTGGMAGTSWIECKVAKPDVDERGRGAQKLQMLRLHTFGRNAVYIVWRAEQDQVWTDIVLPRNPMDWTRVEARYPGIDHISAIQWIVNWHLKLRKGKL